MFLSNNDLSLKIPVQKTDIELVIDAFVNNDLCMLNDTSCVSWGIKPTFNNTKCEIFFEHLSDETVDYHYFSFHELDWNAIRDKLNKAEDRKEEAIKIITEELNRLVKKVEAYKKEVTDNISILLDYRLQLVYSGKPELAYNDLVKQLKGLKRQLKPRVFKAVPLTASIKKEDKKEDWKPSSTMTWVSLMS